MKKILIMATVVCAAMFTNAAQIDWKLTVGAGYEGFSVYAISGTTSSAVATALLSTTATDWTDTISGLTAYIVDSNNSRAKATGKSYDVVAGDNLVFVMFSGAVTEGASYWVMNDYTIASANVYTPPATGTQADIKVTNLGVATTGTLTTTAVPEPASAMLALAGVVMLIRRRK